MIEHGFYWAKTRRDYDWMVVEVDDEGYWINGSSIRYYAQDFVVWGEKINPPK